MSNPIPTTTQPPLAVSAIPAANDPTSIAFLIHASPIEYFPEKLSCTELKREIAPTTRYILFNLYHGFL
jgi:hypothetical protein